MFLPTDHDQRVRIVQQGVSLAEDRQLESILEGQVSGSIGQRVRLLFTCHPQASSHPTSCLQIPVPHWRHFGVLPDIELLPMRTGLIIT